MPLFLAKCVSVPLLLALISWAQQHWGNRRGGFLAGLPVGAGPISLFLALEQGLPYARAAAFGTLQGMIGFTVFAISFITCARYRPWFYCLAAGVAAWAALVTILNILQIPHWLAFVLAMMALALNAFYILKQPLEHAPPVTFPRWNIPVRAMMALALLLIVTMLADALGPAWSGTLGAFPVVWGTLCSFTLAQASRPAVIHMFAGGNRGMPGTIIFFAVIGWLPAWDSLPILYLLAIFIALIVSYISSKIDFNLFLPLLRRRLSTRI